MDVQVKLWLHGGHVWEFCCDEDDPLIFGLVSGLPGADLGGNLPRDGLIQIETRTGERLFLARSSLVSVDVVPIVDELQFLSANRLASPRPGPALGVLTPSLFAMAADALPSEIHRALVGHALAQDASISSAPHEEPCELKLGPLAEPVAKELRSHVYTSCVALGLPELVKFDLQLRLFAIGEGHAIWCEPDPHNILFMVYHCYRQPKAFSGGGMRLFDCSIENGKKAPATAFRDVEIDDNHALFFPSDVVNAGLPVHCEVDAPNDRLFALLGVAKTSGLSEFRLEASSE